MRMWYKLARTCRNVAGMSCGFRTHIVELVQVSYKLVEDRKNQLIFRNEYRGHVLWNSYNSFDKTKQKQFVDIYGDTRANSSHIVDKLVNV